MARLASVRTSCLCWGFEAGVFDGRPTKHAPARFLPSPVLSSDVGVRGSSGAGKPQRVLGDKVCRGQYGRSITGFATAMLPQGVFQGTRTALPGSMLPRSIALRRYPGEIGLQSASRFFGASFACGDWLPLPLDRERMRVAPARRSLASSTRTHASKRIRRRRAISRARSVLPRRMHLDAEQASFFETATTRLAGRLERRCPSRSERSSPIRAEARLASLQVLSLLLPARLGNPGRHRARQGLVLWCPRYTQRMARAGCYHLKPI